MTVFRIPFIACIAERIIGVRMVSFSMTCLLARKARPSSTAEEFDPDRFLDERVHKYLTPNPFIFLPFNAGPRICLGQQFAYNEMSFFIVRLLQSFSDIQLDQDSQEPDTRPPADWAKWPGRKGVEKFWPKSHLTVYAHVSCHRILSSVTMTS